MNSDALSRLFYFTQDDNGDDMQNLTLRTPTRKNELFKGVDLSHHIDANDTKTVSIRVDIYLLAISFPGYLDVSTSIDLLPPWDDLGHVANQITRAAVKVAHEGRYNMPVVYDCITRGFYAMFFKDDKTLPIKLIPITEKSMESDEPFINDPRLDAGRKSILMEDYSHHLLLLTDLIHSNECDSVLIENHERIRREVLAKQKQQLDRVALATKRMRDEEGVDYDTYLKLRKIATEVGLA